MPATLRTIVEGRRHTVALIFDHRRRPSARSNRRRNAGRLGAGAAIVAGAVVLAGALIGPPRPVGVPAGAYRADVSGVVRIDAGMCAGSNAGTGFLITPDLIVTAAHVVDRAVAVALSDGHQTVLGQVIGIDRSTDVALVRAGRPFPGHVFTLAATLPAVGTQVETIGYPRDGPLGFSQGRVTAVDRSLEVQGQPRAGLLQTGAVIRPGYSGAPFVSARGLVVGLADATSASDPAMSYAVTAAAARPLVSSWRSATATLNERRCPSVPAPGPAPPGAGATQATPEIIAGFATYFDAIDTGDYADAYARLAPAERQALSEAAFSAHNKSTYYYGATVATVTPSSAGSELAGVDFTSLGRTPGVGATGRCRNWTLEYTMVDSAGSWLIGPSRARAGVAHQPC